ncbi:CMP-N-acetylneuraminate-beta-galactosamide-alpha-2,3-sialyltransferase 1-like isoform X1 [Xyrauchen texanus]|uniref:CMP-N-acetylneuraminate-beta-galactosamide- alpha-2,3-sialyltransferase 1-like isoform X1 n=1 Tax=Xyrauchen texanus TaxID=154827 RepID=UPI002241AB3B|nr:CMP-N-acetylneuraminate-beta-galactosamide-alpha-2,3-sialyltransferase 1-like isoform X1 [Xyrauchen texanus]
MNDYRFIFPYLRAFLGFIVAIVLFLHIQTSLAGLTIKLFEDFTTKGTCSCDNCIMDKMEDDKWFFVRYNRNVQLILNKKNSVLRQDVLKWWKGLQYASSRIIQKKDALSNYKAVIEKLFSLFPDKEHYSDASPDRCRTCAVVGNSGSLNGSYSGPLIDFHDFVIRINKGPTKGYEKHVGSKTTHRFIYPESAVDIDSSIHLVFCPFKILDMNWLISAFTTKHIKYTYMKVRPTIKANKNKVMILHPAFIKYVYDSWLQKHGRYPSTGFLTLIFALHICDKVSVFGFGPTSDGYWHHYFDRSLTDFRRGNHGGDFENKTTHHLHLRNKIIMYK